MKFCQIPEASHVSKPTPDTKCRDCNAEFNFDHVTGNFFKDDVECPKCGTNVFRDSRLMIKTGKSRRSSVRQSAEYIRSSGLSEAKYAGHKDEQWLHDINLIADGNIKRDLRLSEVKYWEEYKQWADDNRDTCQQMYDQMKEDRNRFVDVASQMPELGGRKGTAKIWTDALRMRQAEIWSGNVDQHDYPLYWEMIKDDNPAYHDYTIMASNAMIDILGGLRDEN